MPASHLICLFIINVWPICIAVGISVYKKNAIEVLEVYYLSDNEQIHLHWYSTACCYQYIFFSLNVTANLPQHDNDDCLHDQQYLLWPC